MATGTVTPTQVYQEVINQGGSQSQAQVAAALVSGIESNGELTDQNPTSTASGLFQFLNTTWNNYAGVSAAKDASFQQQVAKFISESGGPGGNNFYAWAPDLGGSYNGSGSYTTIGGKVGQVISQDATSWGAAAPVPVTAGAASSTGASTSASNGATTGSAITGNITIPGVGNVGTTSQQQTAFDTLESNLSAYGFTPDQLNGPQGLLNWAWGEITNNVDPNQVAIDLQSQPAFIQQFPGFAAANQNLINSGNAAMSVAQYQSYQTTAEQLAQAAGLPPGFINKENIGILAGNNVSTNELTARLNDATALAINSTPEQQAMFNQYFGLSYAQQEQANDPMSFGQGATGNFNPSGSGQLTTGQIAALVLDPEVAEPLIKQQITAAQIGGSFSTAGLSGIDAATALKLSQAGVTQAQGQSAAQQLGVYAPLTSARPGEGGEAAQGVVTSDQLATGNLLGDTTAQRQEQQAIEVGKQAFSGGGGYVANARGTSVGSSNSAGNGSGQ